MTSTKHNAHAIKEDARLRWRVGIELECFGPLSTLSLADRLNANHDDVARVVTQLRREGRVRLTRQRSGAATVSLYSICAGHAPDYLHTPDKPLNMSGVEAAPERVEKPAPAPAAAIKLDLGTVTLDLSALKPLRDALNALLPA